MAKAKAVTASFSYTDDAESRRILHAADELAGKDSRSRSWIIMEALKEYTKAHYPGNPQTDMRVFTGQVEPPKGREPKGKIDKHDIFLLVQRGMKYEEAITYLKRIGYE